MALPGARARVGLAAVIVGVVCSVLGVYIVLRGMAFLGDAMSHTILPGVVALGEGAWYNPDANRVDQAGCINVLTTQRPSPLAKGNPSHSNLVQVEKA